ncbi:ATP-binding cassette domain-containing protein [Paenibacillus sp. Marseille-Q4541]|uniref:ABC transporter ATP-binding protein n=1 Tax=Paenibacillus sp. Marseille-Q4541 TaxID=2831522 RepID=UPI001BA75C87|nr:ATP-binding cassette domain-containing protein [Paenibacillus sp. Marseille-Q4541]
MQPILRVENMRKKHAGTDRPWLFEHVTTDVHSNDRIALIGVSGQGKSTLLRILSRLDLQDDGMMEYRGISYEQVDPREWRTHICYVAQQAVMLEGTVEDNLRLYSSLHQTTYNVELATLLLEKMGLSGLDLTQDAKSLSGGEKQRVALVRSLLMQPEVLLLDEITASLDQGSKKRVEEVLQDWHESHQTAMIWVTHDLEQARKVSNRIWFMAQGTLLHDQTSTEFFDHPSDDEVIRFLNAASGGEKQKCPS